MKIYQLPTEKALASLRSSPDGLSSQTAKHRLKQFGSNHLEHIKDESLMHQFLKQFTQFFALILWLAAGIAFLSNAIHPEKGMLTMGIVIIGVIILNGIFSFWQEVRTARLIETLRNLLPKQVKVVRDHTVDLINTERLVPGDILFVSAGEVIPADILLMEAFDVNVNMSPLTGESVPIPRNTSTATADSLLTAPNILLAGCTLTRGEAKGVVFSTGMHTELGRIAHLTQTVPPIDSPLIKEVRHLSRLIATLATLLGLIFFGIGMLFHLPFWANFLFAIGIIVANVPEGLLPTVSLALAMSARRLAKKKALVRHLPSVETLGSVTVICTDKTGTLTETHMQAKRLYLQGKVHPLDAPDTLPHLKDNPFFHILENCLSYKELNGDPLENALKTLTHHCVSQETIYPCVEQIPFTPERRRFSSLHQIKDGYVLYAKGALESLLEITTQVLTEEGVVPLSPALREEYLLIQETFAKEGLYVLAFASKETSEKEALESNMTLQGLVGLYAPPRKDVKEAINKCHAAGIKVIMITGDHPETARAIAHEIGIASKEDLRVITGKELDTFHPSQLHFALTNGNTLFARVSASQKMRIVEALKKLGEIVAVTGDGVNDAPALKLAHIGIAMGQSGTDVAREASDLILMDDHFATIVSAIEEGRAIFANIRKFITYILSSNIPEIIPFLLFVLLQVPLPLTIIQILIIDLCTDIVPALGLGAEYPSPELLQLPPRKQSERLINFPVIARAYLFLGPIQALFSLTAFFLILHWGGWKWGQELGSTAPLYLQATTATLITIILLQIGNVFLCKHTYESLIKTPHLKNRIILLGVGLEILFILLITYTSLGNALLKTAPFNPHLWLYLIPLLLLFVLLEEVRKWILRKFMKEKTG